MARSRSKPSRRSNGVGAYHMYLGRLLKAANLKGKSKTARAAAFKKAVAQARAQAKKGFSASARAGVSEANKRISAKKAAGRSRRGGMKKAAYKALSPAERRRVRAGKAASASASKVAASRRRASASRKAASKRPASIRAASAKGTRVVTTKKGKKMYYVNGKLVSKATYEAAVGRAASAPKAASRKRRKAASKAAPKAASRKAVSRKAKGASKRKAGSKRKGMRRRKNTGLATVFDGVKQFGTEALTWQGIGGAAVVGVAHGIVAPMVAGYLADMFPQTFKVPVLDVDVTAASFSFTATGLVAGAALAGLGYATGRPVLGLGLGALAFSSGVVIDTVGLVQTRQAALEGGSDEAVASLGDVAYGAIDNQGMVYGDVAYGDVAYGEMYNAGQTYGDVAYGAVMGEAGMDYGTMCASEYADAEAADAEESGADFSEEEGQALMDGPLAWLRRFGRPPRRMTGIRGRKSRHAGRAGHRWGWLIKLVGMNKAAAIASLPPEKRLKVISALRKQAIESLSALMAEQTSATTTEATMAAANERVPAHLLLPPPPMRPNLLPPAQAMGLDLMATGAGGAMGAGGYGAVMYAGSGF